MRTGMGANKFSGTQATEVPQIRTLRKKLEDCKKEVAASKDRCEVAQQQLQKHLQGVESMKKRGGAKPMWLVTHTYHDENLGFAHCCGVFTNKQDALVRRELLKICLDYEENYDLDQYNVVCVLTDPDDATYHVDLEVDCLAGPNVITTSPKS